MKFRRTLLILSCFVACTVSSHALGQDSMFGAAAEIPLYSGTAPGSENWNYSEQILQGASGPRIVNVVRPTLLHFPADHSVGTAMIVAPGGGNRMLMMSYEGVDIAKQLNAVGVDAFVLKYRLRYTGAGSDAAQPGPQAGQNIRELSADDGRQAVKLVRTRAAELNIQPDRVGMIGFSAGGGPIRGAMHGPVETQPNFVALIYATSNRVPITVPAGAPPLFVAVAADDPNFLQSSIDTFLVWQAAKVAAELHIFQMGAHGFVNKGGGADYFMDRVHEWMQINGWLTREE